MVAGGWVLGKAEHYDRERALYAEDCLAFVKQTQPKEWEKSSATSRPSFQKIEHMAHYEMMMGEGDVE